MNESKTMRELHSIREKNYERMKKMSIKDQIKTIQAEAEPIKKKTFRKNEEKGNSS
jgi:hypothetical protein